MKPTLTCEDLVRYLSDYINGDLDETLNEAARNHLATCQNCHDVLDSTQQMISLFREQGQLIKIAESRKSSLYDQIAAAFNAPSIKIQPE
jgi:predicted DNA-binding protein YlxM (UPF0122 family)